MMKTEVLAAKPKPIGDTPDWSRLHFQSRRARCGTAFRLWSASVRSARCRRVPARQSPTVSRSSRALKPGVPTAVSGQPHASSSRCGRSLFGRGSHGANLCM